MGLKTVASLGKEKYERIGSTKAKEILRGMDYITRSKLKAEARNLGTGKVSVLNFIKHINKTHGSVAASKLINATQKHFNHGVDEAAKKRNINRVRLQRTEEETKDVKRGDFISQLAGGRKVESYGVRSSIKDEHGTMKDLKVVGWGKKGDRVGGFAKQNYDNNSSNKPAPSQAPSIGTKPIGFI
ncbi:MAG: hypothetical protein Q8O59_01555 [bacterium]|nr:hypothetical protein [bacterium]